MSTSHDGADPDVRQLLAMLEDRGPDASPAELRDAFVAFVRKIDEMGTPDAEIAGIEAAAIPGPDGPVPVRIYLPPKTIAGDGDCFVFLHGGGWTVGDLETADPGARAICAGLGMRVVSVHYRLAPEHPFPAALDDCMAVVRTIRDQATGAIYVGGESAGANLAAAVALLCRNDAIPLAGQFLINPAVDYRTSSASHQRLGHGDGLTTEAVNNFFDWYIAGADPADPRISPIFAESLVGVAPCFLVTAEFDPLLDDGVAYAKRLVDAGVPLTYLPMPGMMHAWWALIAASPAAGSNTERMLSLARGFAATHR